MVSIRNERHVRGEEVEGIIKSVVVAELNCDTASDLPAVDGLTGRILAQGSIAWDIATGDFYGLNSDGTWVNQSGSDDSSVESLSSPLSSPKNLNVTNELDTEDEENDKIIRNFEDF